MDSISSDTSSEYLVDMKQEFESAVLKTSEYFISIRTRSETNVILEDGTMVPKNLREIDNFGIPVFKSTLLDGSLLYVGEKDGEQIAITVPRNNGKSKELAALDSPVDTAKSSSLLTGAERSDSAHTAVSQTILTATEASNPAHTAISLDMLTAELLSSTFLTANSRSILTAAEMSEMVKTSQSERILTAEDRSDTVYTANGDYPRSARSASCLTANNGLEEALLRTACGLESLVTQDDDSLVEIGEISVEP